MEKVKVRFVSGSQAGKEVFVYKGEAETLGKLVEIIKEKEEKVKRETKEAKVISSKSIKET